MILPRQGPFATRRQGSIFLLLTSFRFRVRWPLWFRSHANTVGANCLPVSYGIPCLPLTVSSACVVAAYKYTQLPGLADESGSTGKFYCLYGIRKTANNYTDSTASLVIWTK